MGEEAEGLRRQLEALRSENKNLRSRVAGAQAKSAVDTRTRYQGVYARHQIRCAKTWDRTQRCRCEPSFYGRVWDPGLHRQCITKRRPTVAEARSLREEVLARVREEEARRQPTWARFSEVQDAFIKDCRDGVALNNRGDPYKPKAIKNLESSLNRLPDSIRRKRFKDLVGGELQEAIDAYRREGLSSSRIHSIICAVSSLHTWAIQRGRVAVSPTKDLRLPAVRSRPRDWIAAPAELVALLQVLKPEDALPWALAAYGTARHQEIQILSWQEVDLYEGTIQLAGDDVARKSEAARRLVPMVSPLRRRVAEQWARQGKPTAGRVCPPRRRSRSGLLALGQLSKRVTGTWREAGLEPICLQDCRHTAATWLDHAGVSPKVASVLMGHRTPRQSQQFGAARITLQRYTHVLEGELERGRDLLEEFLAKREAEGWDEGLHPDQRSFPIPFPRP